jgi:hypothetical protein
MITEQKVIKKVGLLKLAKELANVSQACKILGLSFILSGGVTKSMAGASFRQNVTRRDFLCASMPI